MDDRVTWKSLIVLAVVLTVSGMWLIEAPAHDDASFPMPRSKTLVNECGSCHTAYAPGLLPSRSWRKMLGELSTHFGDDASVDEPVRLALLKELEDMAADGAFSDLRMHRIAAAIPAGAVPQRIIETAYFKALHDDVPQSFWKRKSIGSPTNCGACHPRANEGRFGEREIRIPSR